MNWQTVSPIIISVGVIASTVGAFANVVVALMNNRRLQSIEKNKQIYELVKYRYTELYSILKDIECEHGFINKREMTEELFRQNFSKRERFIELSKLARPLLDTHLKNKLDEIAIIENKKFEPIKHHLLTGVEFERNTLPDWGDSVNNFLDTLSGVVQEQVSRLTNS